MLLLKSNLSIPWRETSNCGEPSQAKITITEEKVAFLEGPRSSTSSLSLFCFFCFRSDTRLRFSEIPGPRLRSVHTYTPRICKFLQPKELEGMPYLWPAPIPVVLSFVCPNTRVYSPASKFVFLPRALKSDKCVFSLHICRLVWLLNHVFCACQSSFWRRRVSESLYAPLAKNGLVLADQELVLRSTHMICIGDITLCSTRFVPVRRGSAAYWI